MQPKSDAVLVARLLEQELQAQADVLGDELEARMKLCEDATQ